MAAAKMEILRLLLAICAITELSAIPVGAAEESKVSESCLEYMTALQASLTDEEGIPITTDLADTPTSVTCLTDFGECLKYRVC